MQMTISGPPKRFHGVVENQEKRKLKQDLKEFAKDILENSYKPLIETIYSLLEQNQDQEMDDPYIYIKITAYFMCLFRQFAYEEQKKSGAMVLPHLQRIGPSLGIQNIDWIFKRTIYQIIESRKRNQKFHEYIAGIEYLD